MNLLNLTKKEMVVLRALPETPTSIANIVRKAKLSRSTVVYCLSKLKKRGLATRHRVSLKRGGWKSATLQEKEELIQLTEKSLGSEQRATEVIDISTKDGSIKIYRGLAALHKTAASWVEKHKSERSYAIQPEKAWKSWRGKVSVETFDTFNNQLQKRGAIVDLILPDYFKNTDIESFVKQTYKERPQSISRIPSRFLDFSSDIEITRNSVFIVNWESEVAIEIKNSDIAKAFISIFSYIKESSKN